MRYILVGPEPPPLGGISVFLYRYGVKLRGEGHQVELLDLSKLRLVRKLVAVSRLLLIRDAVVHVNVISWSVLLTIVLGLNKTKLIFHDHGTAKFLSTYGRWKRCWFQMFLRRANECWLVGEHLREFYDRAAISLPRQTLIRHAYLPPPEAEEADIRATYDWETKQFVNQHRPLLIANAWKIVFLDGVDLYGLDMSVETVARLKDSFPKIGLLFALGEVGDETYLNEIKQRICEHAVDENIHFMTGQRELWPLFKDADLFLRPTSADGYPLSVEEALHFGCPVVASDVCKRPASVAVFRNRDSDDLWQKAVGLLQPRAETAQVSSA